MKSINFLIETYELPKDSKINSNIEITLKISELTLLLDNFRFKLIDEGYLLKPKCEDCGGKLPEAMKHKCYECYDDIYFPK